MSLFIVPAKHAFGDDAFDQVERSGWKFRLKVLVESSGVEVGAHFNEIA